MDPTRLLDEEDDRFEARLLRTALRDEPPEGAMNRAALALGVGASAGALVTAAAGAKAATAGAAASHVAKLGAVGIAKWVSIGLVSGLVVTGGIRYAADPELRAAIVGTPEPARAAARTTIPATRPALHAALSEPSAEAASEPTKTVEPVREEPKMAPPVLRAPGAPPVQAAANDPAPAPDLGRTQSLAAELAPLERARRALVTQDAEAALRELDSYERTPRSGVLDAEAEILRVEALLQAGRGSEARALAERSLARAPNGPHAARLREITRR
ncbi:MAG TPA: hypothetical protein VHE30_20335 [Polyangiaceae bacterium]|nr:hypothetical protein [Polyangiaceae bacterium]